MMVVTPGFETHSLLSSLSPSPALVEIGSSKFVLSYCVNLERLVMQACLDAGAMRESASSSIVTVGGGMENGGGGGGEHVVEAFRDDPSKVSDLVGALLALELWRTRVLFSDDDDDDDDDGRAKEDDDDDDDDDDEEGEEGDGDGGDPATTTTTTKKGLAHRLAENGNALRASFVLHAETTIVSMLGLIFYGGIPPELLSSSSSSSGGGGGGGGDDDNVLLSLVDYCARQLVSRERERGGGGGRVDCDRSARRIFRHSLRPRSSSLSRPSAALPANRSPPD
jgi:hypothetical protein